MFKLGRVLKNNIDGVDQYTKQYTIKALHKPFIVFKKQFVFPFFPQVVGWSSFGNQWPAPDR